MSDRMRATLGGTKFRVEPQAEDIQLIAAGQSTTWEWIITAAENGKSPLYLILNLEIESGSGDVSYRPVRPPLYQAEVAIFATLSQRAAAFLGHNWQWLWAAILVPVAGWFWARYRKRNAANRGGNRAGEPGE